ncbi:MAG: hypothetical protein KatS3mg105_0038 [Gemmatales bacterium]|nr:MAG: hypothetical protein KatS3mg105_0038 [Gemmatales bacterium]
MEYVITDFIFLFCSILYEALPFIILGAAIAGFLEEFVPQQWLVRIIPKNAVLAVGISGGLGLLFPMCECGIIVVMRRLLRKGLPLSCCVAYMLAGPIINVIVILSTYVAFAPYEPAQMGGFFMVGFRVAFGYVVACLTALIVEWQYRKYGNNLLSPSVTAGLDDADHEPDVGVPKPPFWQRLGNVSETALHDFVDITVFLILGALLASFTRQTMIYNPGVQEFIQGKPVLSHGLMMVLAVLLNLCSEADAFVAANLGGTAIPPTAKLAFLVLGPMIDIKLYFMYTRVFRQRLIWIIFSTVAIQVFIYSLLFYFYWQYRWVTPTGTG